MTGYLNDFINGNPTEYVPGNFYLRTDGIVTNCVTVVSRACVRRGTATPIPNTCPLKYKPVALQSVKHTDGITYTRCMEHMEITDESLGLAKPKAKAAKGPMRPEHDDVRMNWSWS